MNWPFYGSGAGHQVQGGAECRLWAGVSPRQSRRNSPTSLQLMLHVEYGMGRKDRYAMRALGALRKPPDSGRGAAERPHGFAASRA
jgi:hypothetical protein